MYCPDCSREIGTASQCPCGWSGEHPAQAVHSGDPQPEDDRNPRTALDADSIGEQPSSSIADTPAEPSGGVDSPSSEFHDNEFRVDQQFEGATIQGPVSGVAVYNIDQTPVQRSLKDTYIISAAYADPSVITGVDLGPYMLELQHRRLLIIGCENSDISYDGAKAIINNLGISEQKYRRGFNVDDAFQQDVNVTIESLLPDKKDSLDRKNRKEDQSTAVVVTALSNPAQIFVCSLLADPAARDRLQENSVYLLFVVNPAYIEEQRIKRTFKSKYQSWNISYLQYLLKSYSLMSALDVDDVENRIRRQAERGWWDPEESKLCHDVKDYLDQGTLIKELEHRDRARLPDAIVPETAFRDQYHIEKTVLYVATYFRDLTPSEFCEVVEALLPNRDLVEITDSVDTSRSANAERVPRPALELWNDFKDRFITKYLRETVADADMTIVIDFARSAARNSFKRYLDRSRRYYVKDQFNILLQKGFLFHPSTRVSENMIRLTAENAVAYPDEFSKDWLVEIIKNLRERYHAPRNAARQRENPLFYFLDRVRFNNEGWGYSRIAELIRTLIKVPQKSDMVNRCLADLMRLKHYDAVLNIIKRLRFADEFDGLYWLKQLFDRRVDSRDAEDIRPQAFSYLYYTLKEANGDIHRTLDKLDSWLPEADTNRRGYSGSAYFALRLLMKYCFETIDRFDENDVSASIEFPLFNLPTDTTVEEGNRLIDRLVRWLLHPALTGALKVSQSESWMKRLPEVADDRKRANRLIADLLAEWSVILPDRRQPPTINEHEHHATLETTVSDRIREVFDQFLSRVASQLSEAQRKDLITYWDESNRRSLFSPRNTAAPQDREQAAARQKHEANRWYRVFSLGQDFRNLTSSTNLT